MIAECKCGEVLAEDAQTCPACGAPNSSHRPAEPPRLLIAITGGVLIYIGVQQGRPWYWPAIVMMLAALALRLRWRSGRQ